MAQNPDEYPSEDKPREVTEADEVKDDLASSSDGAYRRAKRNQRTKALAVAGVLVAATGIGYYALKPDGRPAPTPRPTPSPPNTFTTTPTTPVAAPVYSRLDASPRSGNLPRAIVGGGRQTLTFTFTANDGSVTINRMTLPFAQQNGLRLDTDCPNKTLGDGEQCAAQLTFEPTAPGGVNAELLVSGQRYDRATGKTAPLNQSISITGLAEPTPAPPAPPTAPTAAAPPPKDPREARIAAARKAFLDQQSASFASNQTTSAPMAATSNRPLEANWRDIGFTQSVSSFPVDMTRVITMDKPLPAVISIPIDTRNTSRAVARIERDIYGNDGITPIVERGSVVIGKVSTVSDASEEKVSIVWQRLTRPDGVSFTFEGTTGDAMGRSGALGYIDNRWLERFGAGIAASLVNAATAFAINGSQTTTSAGGSFSSSSGSYLGGTSQTQLNGRALATQALEQNVQPLLDNYIKQQQRISPIRSVPAGTRIVIFSNQDFWLKPVPPANQDPTDGIATVTGVGGQSRAGAMAQATQQGQQGQQPVPQVNMSLTAPTAVDALRQRQDELTQLQIQAQQQSYRGLPQGALYNPNVPYQGATGQALPYVPTPYVAAPQNVIGSPSPDMQQQQGGTQQLPAWAR